MFKDNEKGYLPWREFKISLPKQYRKLILGDSRWNATGWYMYINKFEDRNDEANMYINDMVLSYTFIFPEKDCTRKLFEEYFADDLNDRSSSIL